MLLKYLSRENDALKHSLEEKKAVSEIILDHNALEQRVTVFEHVQNSESNLKQVLS